LITATNRSRIESRLLAQPADLERGYLRRCKVQEREFHGDSYVVNVTPPGTTFPWVKVVRRKKRRLRGRIAEEVEIRAPGFGDMDAFDEANIDETARQIGRAILDDSEIIREWRDRRQHR
jgi:hypothetical protein